MSTRFYAGQKDYIVQLNLMDDTWNAGIAGSTIAVAQDAATNATYYPTFAIAGAGNTQLRVSTGKLSFNPSTGVLTVAGFSGPLTGNVTGNVTGALTGNATSASAVAGVDDNATNANVYLLWSSTTSGSVSVKLSSTKLSFNPSTGTLTATNLTATGAINAVTVTTTGNGSIGGNLIVTGNLTVNGTTQTINSTVMTVDDPVITLGGDTAPAVDDGKDRGIEFRWHNGSVAKIGFYGFDDSTGKFIFIPDATNTSEVFAGAAGTIVANLEGNVTGTLTGNATGTAANVTGIVAAVNGGTGQNTYAVGDILYASGAAALSKLIAVATGNVLLSGGVTTAPAWGKVGLQTHISGTLLIANGGTSATDAATALSNLGGITPAAVDTKLNALGLGTVAATPVMADINSATVGGGMYYTNSGTTGTFPAAAIDGFLLHRVYGTGGFQMWQPMGADTIWFRRRNGSAWQTWKQLPSTTDTIYTPSGLSVDITSTDLNTRILSGFYRGQTLTNAPDVGWWFVTVEAHDTAFVKQTITAYGSSRPVHPLGTTFVRVMTSGAWGAWQSIGGGATGGGSDKAFYENDVTITANYTIGTNKNAMTAGPITIANAITVTVPTGSTWTIV